MTSIGIDPGHGGGREPGCCYGGLIERDRVELAAEILHTHLLARGLQPVHTRRAGENPWHITRGLRTRGCACVVSLHINASRSAAANGLEVYYWPGSSSGLALAAEIASRCPPQLKPRGLPGPRVIAAYDGPSTRDDWLRNPRAVLRYHRPPAVLVEMGYASHDGDRAYLLTDIGLEAVCMAIAEAAVALGGCLDW